LFLFVGLGKLEKKKAKAFNILLTSTQFVLFMKSFLK